jgi:hypothetical protein
MQVSAPTERAFGVGVGGVCVAIGALLWWRGHSTLSLTLLVLGGVLVALGRLAPSALRVPHRYWWRFAQVLGWVNARVLLTLFFVLVLTPVGVVMRLFGRNPLRPPQAQTTWGPYSVRRRDPKHYERMF